MEGKNSCGGSPSVTRSPLAISSYGVRRWKYTYFQVIGFVFESSNEKLLKVLERVECVPLFRPFSFFFVFVVHVPFLPTPRRVIADGHLLGLLHYAISIVWCMKRALEAQHGVESSIECSLEAIGLIDERHEDDGKYNESLFR